jgi:hypothetical protein
MCELQPTTLIDNTTSMPSPVSRTAMASHFATIPTKQRSILKKQ